MRVHAVIVAAGRGTRMGGELPKVFLPLAGVPILIHTLRCVEQASLVEAGVLVVPPGWQEYALALLEPYGPFRLSWQVIPGGIERQDSVRLGLSRLDPQCEVVVIHDGARPFVRPEWIEESVRIALEIGGAIVALPAQDTVKRVSCRGVIVETLPREGLWLAQTPQTFRASLIRKAHTWAHSQGILATDDASLVEKMGGEVRVVRGTSDNIKITTPEDLLLAEGILRSRSR